MKIYKVKVSTLCEHQFSVVLDISPASAVRRPGSSSSEVIGSGRAGPSFSPQNQNCGPHLSRVALKKLIHDWLTRAAAPIPAGTAPA